MKKEKDWRLKELKKELDLVTETICSLEDEFDIPHRKIGSLSDTIDRFPENEEIDDFEVLYWFTRCAEIDKKPPEWIMSRLNTVFTKFLKAGLRGDDVKLDDFLDLKKTQFEQKARERVYDDLCYLVNTLTNYYRMHIDDACQLVLTNTHYDNSDNHTTFNIGIHVDSLDEKNNKDSKKIHPDYIGMAGLKVKYRKWRKQNGESSKRISELIPWNHEKKSTWIRRFKNIDDDLKSKYQLYEYLTD